LFCFFGLRIDGSIGALTSAPMGPLRGREHSSITELNEFDAIIGKELRIFMNELKDERGETTDVREISYQYDEAMRRLCVAKGWPGGRYAARPLQT
jgi:hypothetical protein